MSQLSHIPKIRLFLISELEPCNLFLYIPNSQTAHPEMLVYSANIAQRYRAMASMEQFLGSNSEQELLLTMQQTFCISPRLKGEIQNQKRSSSPATMNNIPDVRVMLALAASSMLPILIHFRAKIAISKPTAPRTIPTIINALTPWNIAAGERWKIHINISVFIFLHNMTFLYALLNHSKIMMGSIYIF